MSTTTLFQEKSGFIFLFFFFFYCSILGLDLCNSLSILASCASLKTSPYKGIYSSDVGKTQISHNNSMKAEFGPMVQVCGICKMSVCLVFPDVDFKTLVSQPFR